MSNFELVAYQVEIFNPKLNQKNEISKLIDSRKNTLFDQTSQFIFTEFR